MTAPLSPTGYVKWAGKGPPGVMVGQLGGLLDMLQRGPSGNTSTSFFLFFLFTRAGLKSIARKSLLTILYFSVSFPRPSHIDLSRAGPLGKPDQRGPMAGFWNLWT